MRVYNGTNRTLNILFLMLELLQLVLFAACIYLLTKESKESTYGYHFTMWAENVFLEIPMIAISYHLTE